MSMPSHMTKTASTVESLVNGTGCLDYMVVIVSRRRECRIKSSKVCIRILQGHTNKT
jgi:hypothetical protein